MQMSHSISAKMAQILLASFCVCYTGGLSCKPNATVITYPASFCKKNAIISSKKKMGKQFAVCYKVHTF